MLSLNKTKAMKILQTLLFSFCIALGIVGTSVTLTILYEPKPVQRNIYINVDGSIINEPKYQEVLVSHKGQIDTIPIIGK